VKILKGASTRRQLIRVAAAAATVSGGALTRKSASAMPYPVSIPLPSPPGDHHCFLKGTKISTPSRERLVQDLRIGDEVLTLSGPKTIKWIGYRKFEKGEGAAWQNSVMPIRVARSAIDNETPHRDLYLSHSHSIYLNNVLIPVGYLVNDTSIAPRMPSDMSAIEYYHVELETHEVIFAEGASVESYFDNGTGRESYSNFVQYERLYGTARQSEMTPFAPVLGYAGGRQEVNGLIRALVSNVVDVRDPIQVAYDQIVKRAAALLV
jgi:hypothetical protein